MTKKLPNHLGGQGKGNVDVALIEYILSTFKDINTMVDVGCGNGCASLEYNEVFGVDYTGIDGDYLRLPKSDKFLLHDFTQGKVIFPDPNVTFDLGYSFEFLEHVSEEYQSNYMDIFSRCKYLVLTAAPPGQPGHHHVNCKPRKYWIDVFEKYGFKFLEEITKTSKSVSNIKSSKGISKGNSEQYFKLSGMVFEKVNQI
jgi:SAM-dependent methyltransferase